VRPEQPFDFRSQAGEGAEVSASQIEMSSTNKNSFGGRSFGADINSLS
jgi:hypothetical protein